MWKEFKEFALKGNVLDLAIGVIIGAAMGKIIDSVVKDLIMPLISALFGGKVDFSNMFVLLGDAPAGVPHTYEALTKAGVPVFAYGNFITVFINFLLLAFAVFVIIKAVNKLSKKEAEAPAETPEDVVLLREIRDSLKK
ncbi:Large-conductance mechanosensitive channel [Ephemeroptericola cinctiostellae]|uniref:Large-conductance mechanosensitive channel n=1 Tax=Ephemeroptericola cinctiostellae TaxID=2268024 RepID=A0A345D9D2_9BURK|nr:large conductance mechanosensitive channel protein MscL [Ephemeroptericola cinctiostellae]AXF84970.1 Large-conductance mechanosensitive channel [Ephemeroptericola cinctiostellae]